MNRKLFSFFLRRHRKVRFEPLERDPEELKNSLATPRQGLARTDRQSTLSAATTRPAASGMCPTTSYTYLYDGLFLSIVCVLSAAPYITGLGLYVDDWVFWAAYNGCSDHSLIGLIACSDFGVSDVRPVQRLYLATMFRLYGNDPVGCHVLMLAVSILGILLVYLTLRELYLPRSITLTLPLIYAFLPHYCTAKFWIACSVAGLSMTLYFLSVYCAIRALRTELWKQWCWSIASIWATLTSALSYEMAIPLFTLTPVLLWHYSRVTEASPARTSSNSRRNAGLVTASVGAVIAAGAVKIALQTRSPFHFRFLNRIGTVMTQAVFELFSFNFGRYGFGMPLTVWRIIRYYPNRGIFVLGAVLTVVIFLYLLWMLPTELPDTRTCAILAVGGIIVFGLTYALFAAQPVLMFTATGLDNRVAIAGALGTAMLEVGAIAWLSGILKKCALAKEAFCLMVAMVCGSGFLANSTLASFWILAFRTQQQILADIRVRFPALPERTTFLLDGICTKLGPGPVFGTDYDLAGALQIVYGDLTIRANVVRPTTAVEKGYLKFQGIWGEEDRYSYQRNMVVYDFKRKASSWLVDAETARRYFGANDPRRNDDCASQEAEPF